MVARRKSTYRRRKPMLKAAKRARMTLKRNVRDNVLSCKRSVVLDQLSIYKTWSHKPLAFTLAMLPNYTEFTALFSQYKINAIKIQFIPDYNSGDAMTALQSGAGGQYLAAPRLYTVVDKSGIIDVDSEVKMLQYSAKRIIRKPRDPFGIYISGPQAQLETETATLFAGATESAKRWIDLDNPSVVFRGCAVAGILPFATSATASFNYQVIATYYMQFKQAR